MDFFSDALSAEGFASANMMLNDIMASSSRDCDDEEGIVRNQQLFDFLDGSDGLSNTQVPSIPEMGPGYSFMSFELENDPGLQSLEIAGLHLPGQLPHDYDEAMNSKQEAHLKDTAMVDHPAAVVKKKCPTLPSLDPLTFGKDHSNDGSGLARLQSSNGSSLSMPATPSKRRCLGTGETETNGKQAKLRYSKGAAPSKYCHVCGRSAKTVSVALCGNNKIGLCRKVVCDKCLLMHQRESWEAAKQPNSTWTCMHCRNECPERARCHQYQRNNMRRRMRSTAAAASNTPRAGVVNSGSRNLAGTPRNLASTPRNLAGALRHTVTTPTSAAQSEKKDSKFLPQIDAVAKLETSPKVESEVADLVQDRMTTAAARGLNEVSSQISPTSIIGLDTDGAPADIFGICQTKAPFGEGNESDINDSNKDGSATGLFLPCDFS